MSTRMLTLFTTAAALAVAGGVTAAGVSLAAPPPPPPLPGGATAPSVAPAAPSGKEPDSPEECRDANCEIEVTDGQEIPLGGQNGVQVIKVRIEGTQVTFTVRTRNAKAVTVVDASIPHSVTHINGIALRPRLTADGRLLLKISHD